jgi:hypothetical protein
VLESRSALPAAGKAVMQMKQSSSARGHGSRYVQRLPALDLSIERATAQVPSDGWFYLRKEGIVIGRFRSLRAAKEAWEAEKVASSWQPPVRDELAPEEKLKRDMAARQRLASAEHWNRVRQGYW